MELDDCAFPLLESIDITADPNEAFDGANIGLLIGARPRPRAWSAPTCWRPTARSSSRRARPSTPAPPTTCGSSWWATRPTPTRSSRSATRRTSPRERFTAMTRLDENRAVVQLAKQARRRRRRRRGPRRSGATTRRRCSPTSSTPRSTGKRAVDQVDEAWYETSTSRRSASAARRSSRRAARPRPPPPPTPRSTTSATGCSAPTACARWRCRSDGSYGVEEGLISRFPVRVSGGAYEIAQGLEVGDFARERIDRTVQELKEERDAVQGSASSASAAGRRPEVAPVGGDGVDRRALRRVLRRASPGPPCGPGRPSEAGEHAVEVVLLDPHGLGHLGDRDAGARADELEGLLRARARARAGARGRRRSARRRGGAGAARGRADEHAAPRPPRPPTPSRASSAARRRSCSCTSGSSSFSLLAISRRFSSRKSAIVVLSHFRVS